MNNKKICVVWLVLTLLFSLPLPSFAIDSSHSFRVTLTVDGNSEVSVQAGQEFSVTVTLERMDAAEDWSMYAWQTEVSFDSSAFELAEDSVYPASGVGYSNHPRENENRLFFSAYSISKNGRTYPGSLEVASFKLKARKTGTFRVWNKNYLVGTAAGADRYPCESSDLSIIVTEGSETPGQNGGSSANPGEPGRSNAEIDFTDIFRFQDVPMDAWYVDAVTYNVQRGLFKGVSETIFDPQGNMTRAMLVTVLHRLEGTPAAAGNSGFEDVPSDTWYTEAVAWARESGVVKGYSDTQFGPEDFITREQMATILYRYTEKKGKDVSQTAELSRYSDENEISEWAMQAMSWTSAEGLITGRSETTLNPKETATRAEVATILMRYCQKL